MSSRQLKKLRAQEEQKKALAAQQLSAGDETSSDEEESAIVDTRPRAKNVFAAFAALGSDEDEDEDEDEDKEREDGNKEDGSRNIVRPSTTTAKPSKKKKKSKKKGKSKAETGENNAAAEGPAVMGKHGHGQGKKLGGGKSGKPVTQPEDDGLDEIDRALRELNMQKQKQQQNAPQNGQTGAGASTDEDVQVKVNMHDLKVMHELRDVFGRDTIRAARADEAHNAGGATQGERVEGNPGMVMVDLETFLRGTPPVMAGMGRRAGAIMASAVAAAGKRAMSDAVARRNPFIEFKDTWPRAPSGGLAMRQVTPATAAGAAGSVVEYTYTHSPAYVQLDNTFFTLVMMHDHHPLIQFLKQHPYHIASLIQVSRVAKQDQNAALAADLCERALFSFGRSTLSSFRQKLIEGRARLSFRRPENRQFLLVGYYYIKSLIPRGTNRTALAWVKLFLSLMPNDPYGLLLWGQALAVRAGEEQWLLEAMGEEDGKSEILALQRNPMRAYLRQSLVVARLQLGDEAGARAALATGLARLPWLYAALFQALSLDVPRAVWGQQPRDAAETLYTTLYVQLTRDLWESGPVVSLLREVAGTATKDTTATLLPAPAVTTNIARFVYLDGTPATMALVPGEMLHVTPNYDFDPLPPAREQNIFSHVGQERPWIVAANEEQSSGGGGGGLLWGGAGMGLLPDMVRDEQFEDPGFDDDEFGMTDEEDNTEQGAAENSQEQYERQREGMPGAWVEDVEDEEFQ